MAKFRKAKLHAETPNSAEPVAPVVEDTAVEIATATTAPPEPVTEEPAISEPEPPAETEPVIEPQPPAPEEFVVPEPPAPEPPAPEPAVVETPPPLSQPARMTETFLPADQTKRILLALRDGGELALVDLRNNLNLVPTAVPLSAAEVKATADRLSAQGLIGFVWRHGKNRYFLTDAGRGCLESS